MLIGVAFYSFTIGIISAFFTGKETKDSLLSKKLNNLDEFCKELNIKDETKQKLKASIEYSANKITYQWLDPKQVIFNELPMRLKYELLVSLYKKLILDCPFFNSFDISFVIKIVPLLKPLFVKAGEPIWSEGDYSSFVFFLVVGQVNFYVDFEQTQTAQNGGKSNKFYASSTKFFNDEKREQNSEGTSKKDSAMIKNNKLLFKIMTNGSYFGEVDIILRRKRVCDLVTALDCDLYILSRTVG